MKHFATQIRVRFGHVDPAGIAYYPRIFEYLHAVTEELWEQHVGVRYDELIMVQKIGFPLVHSEVDFQRPLRFGDRPIVRVTCFHLGTSSLGLHFVFEQDGETALEARLTTVCTDIVALKSRPIPAEWRAKLEQLREPPAEARVPKARVR
ncbi:MAG TPA: thioesterase family protein [Planctomycetota bacterium]|nr:thioesterase family protein [Planctomycetota bacterium]